MVNVTFCLVTDQQIITSFKNSKLVTACSSVGQGSKTLPVFYPKCSSTNYAIQCVNQKLFI